MATSSYYPDFNPPIKNFHTSSGELLSHPSRELEHNVDKFLFDVKKFIINSDRPQQTFNQIRQMLVKTEKPRRLG